MSLVHEFLFFFFLFFFYLQDTLIAMEALFAFTQADPNRNVFDLMVTLESTASPTWFKTYHLTKNDYTQLYINEVRMEFLVLGYKEYFHGCLLHVVKGD